MKMLIGNKVDLEDSRQVTTEDGQNLARELGMDFMETSAADQINIDSMFRDMAKKILEQVSKQETGTGDEGFKKLLENKTTKIQKGCMCTH